MFGSGEFEGIFSTVRAAWRRRQTRWILNGLDRHMLADIGLDGMTHRRPSKVKVHVPTQNWLDSLR